MLSLWKCPLNFSTAKDSITCLHALAAAQGTSETPCGCQGCCGRAAEAMQLQSCCSEYHAVANISTVFPTPSHNISMLPHTCMWCLQICRCTQYALPSAASSTLQPGTCMQIGHEHACVQGYTQRTPLRPLLQWGYGDLLCCKAVMIRAEGWHMPCVPGDSYSLSTKTTGHVWLKS